MNIEKYNPIWLEYNNFDDNWHNEQAAFLENAIKECQHNHLVIVVTDAHALEAMAHILFNFEFRVDNSKYAMAGTKTITIRIR